MAALFGDSTPTPAPVPMSPSAAENEAARAERLNKERAAIAESKLGGRRSTMVGGMQIAEDEQQARGKKRLASREMV